MSNQNTFIKTNSNKYTQISSLLHNYINISNNIHSIIHSNIFRKSYKNKIAENIDIEEEYDRTNNEFYQEESNIEDFLQEYSEVECKEFVSEKVILKVIWDDQKNIPKIFFEDTNSNTLDSIENFIEILEMFLAYQSGFIKNLLAPENQTEEGLVKAIRKLKSPISMDPENERFIFWNQEEYKKKHSNLEENTTSDESLFDEFFNDSVNQESQNYENFLKELKNEDEVLKNGLKNLFSSYLASKIQDKKLKEKIKAIKGMPSSEFVTDYTIKKFESLKNKKNQSEMKFNITEHIDKINYLKEKFPKPWNYFNELYKKYSDDLENFSQLFTYPFKNIWIEFNWKESGKEKSFECPVTFIVNGLITIETDEGNTKQTSLSLYSHSLKDSYNLLTHLKDKTFDININRIESLKIYILSNDIKEFIENINIGDVKYDLNKKRIHIIKRCKMLIENNYLPLADNSFLDEITSIKNIKKTEFETKFSSKETKSKKKIKNK